MAKGGEWKFQIYFDPNADDAKDDHHLISEENLLSQLEELIETTEKIERVYLYKTPISEIQLTHAFLYHEFVVFQTKNWWWSIEKNGEFLVIQRSKTLEAVKDKFRKQLRVTKEYWGKPTEIKSGVSKISMKNLIDWLHKENWLQERYDLLSSNCQHFGNAVYHYATTATTAFRLGFNYLNNAIAQAPF